MKTGTLTNAQPTKEHTSSTPTVPKNLQAAPRVHGRKTQNNTPGMLSPQHRHIAPTSEGEAAPPCKGEAAPPSEGALAPTSEGANSEAWNAMPRQKQTKTRNCENKNNKRRRSPRLHPQDLPVERVKQVETLETVQEEE